MRTLVLTLTLGAAAIAAATAVLAADDPPLLGKDAPALETKEFLQSDGRTSVADFKGEVLLVEKFATWCGPCKATMPHLTGLMEKYGKQGLNVISITNEPKDTVMKFMTQLNVAPIGYTVGCGGGAEAYPASGIPKGFLIGVDGKVIWEGQPANLPDKVIEAELKKVKVTDEMRAARATKALAYAETLIAAKDVLRGVNVLDQVAKDFAKVDLGKKASTRKAEIEKDAVLGKELAAQRALDKIVGGMEMPKEKLKGKERDPKAKQLDSFAKAHKDDAPATAEMAATWSKVMREDWVSEHK